MITPSFNTWPCHSLGPSTYTKWLIWSKKKTDWVIALYYVPWLLKFTQQFILKMSPHGLHTVPYAERPVYRSTHYSEMSTLRRNLEEPFSKQNEELPEAQSSVALKPGKFSSNQRCVVSALMLSGRPVIYHQTFYLSGAVKKLTIVC